MKIEIELSSAEVFELQNARANLRVDLDGEAFIHRRLNARPLDDVLRKIIQAAEVAKNQGTK